MSDDTTLAAVTHLLALFTWVIGPVIIMLVNEDSDFVDENVRNALNWQITLTLLSVVAAILTLVLVGLLLIPVLGLLNLVFCVIAAVKASDGEAWEYPLTLDLV